MRRRLLTCVGMALAAGCSRSVQTDPAPAPPQTVPSVTLVPLDRVAVYVQNRTSAPLGTDVLRETEDEVAQNLASKGYTIAEHDDVVKALAAQRSEVTSSTTPEALQSALVSAAKTLHLSAVLLITVTLVDSHQYPPVLNVPTRYNYQARGSVTARFVQVESGRMLWTSAHTGTIDVASPDEGTHVVSWVAGVVSERIPGPKALLKR